MSPLPSQIDSVKLYHSGATVFRTVVVEAPDGRMPQEIEVSGLPLALMDPSVKLRVTSLDAAQGELVAADLRVGLDVPRNEPPKDPPDLAKLKALEAQIAKKSDLIQQLAREVEILGQIEVPDRPVAETGKPPPPSPMSARVALEDFLAEALEARAKQIRAERILLEALDEDAAAERDRRDRASTADQIQATELRKTVVARLRQGATPIQKAVLTLEYFIPGARWAPAYQCRLAKDGRSAQIQLRALVCQRSGEDWKGVKLLLSTAAPLRWSEIPELTEIRIGRAQPVERERRGFRPPPVGGQRLFGDFDRDRAAALRRVPGVVAWSAPLLAIAPPPDGGPSGGAASLARADRMMSLPAAPPAAFAGAPAPEEDTGVYEPQTMELSALADESEMIAPEPARSVMAEAEEDVAYARASRRMAKVAAAPRARAKEERRSARDNGESARGGASAEDVEQALIFTQLMLPAPDHPSRNKLRPLDREEQYLTLLRRRSPRADRRVMEVVQLAEHSAIEVGRLPLPKDAADVRAAAGYFDFVYLADAPVDVPSDGGFHSVALGERTATSEVHYVIVPRLEPHAYRTAHLENPIDAPMLPGPAEVYVGGEYVLTTALPTVPPKGKFHLGLGVEQAIKVARNTRFLEKRSGDKVVATNDLWHEIEVELINHLDREAACEVRERIPQPAEGAEVEVKETDVEPPWEEYTQEDRAAPLRGGRRWKITVPPKGNVKLAATYAVKIYANNEVIGGNRREA